MLGARFQGGTHLIVYQKEFSGLVDVSPLIGYPLSGHENLHHFQGLGVTRLNGLTGGFIGEA